MKDEKIILKCNNIPQFYIYKMTNLEFEYNNNGDKIWKDIVIELSNSMSENVESNVVKVIDEQNGRKGALKVKILILNVKNEKFIHGYELIGSYIKGAKFVNYTYYECEPIQKARTVIITLQIEDIKIIESKEGK